MPMSQTIQNVGCLVARRRQYLKGIKYSTQSYVRFTVSVNNKFKINIRTTLIYHEPELVGRQPDSAESIIKYTHIFVKTTHLLFADLNFYLPFDRK